MPAEERAKASEQLKAAVAGILADCPDSDDDFSMEMYLHDRLTQRCTYDTEAAQSDSVTDPNAYTAYGALVEESAVCEGYAKAMQLLLREVNIPVDVVTGTAIENNEAHMWNLVTINGNDYHLDATWNDSGDRNQHTFFNITTEQLQKSCLLDDGQNLPVCTATTDNYFVRQGTLIDTYERQAIAQAIAKRILAGDTTIQLQFTEGKYDNGLLFLKNQKLMSSMVNSHLADSGLQMWEYTLWSEASQHVLTLIKE